MSETNRDLDAWTDATDRSERSEADDASGAQRLSVGHGREGWDFERDLESQGHSRVWRSCGMEAVCSERVEPVARARGSAAPCLRGLSGPMHSDEWVFAEVCTLLAEHPLIDASRIEIEVRLGFVTLRGSVGSKLEQRLSEAVIAEVPDVEHIVNLLIVTSPG